MNNWTVREKVDYIFTLQQEFDLSYKLVCKGLGELQRIDYSNDFYFLPLLLLSQGIERFLKSYIIAYKIENEEENLFPENLRTHSLVKLLDIIKQDFYVIGSRDTDIKDEQYLSNTYLNKLLDILSDFGKRGRYYNINHLMNGNNNSPISNWQELEQDLIPLTREEYLKLMDVDTRNNYYKRVNNEIIIIIEKFLSILSRQHIFGRTSKVFLGATIANFSTFGYMYDNDYGKTDYTLVKKEYGHEYTAHKRTLIDRLKTSLFYKHKKILKSQFEGEWPFKSESATLESRANKFYIVIIDGYEYALNGKTSSRLKLPTPNKGGVVVDCKSTDKFLKIAQNL